jgi:hypothetical protein
LPVWQGSASVLDTDERDSKVPVKFRVAAWGPNTPQSGGRDYYNLRLTTDDPDAFAHMVAEQRARKREAGAEGADAPQPVRNKPQGFELKQVGTGIIFQHDPEEMAANPKLPKFWGYALVQLPSGPSYLDVRLWHRPAGTTPQGKPYPAFYSGGLDVHDPQRAAAARAAKPASDPK